jgi:predicted Fe-Mo cluster-binding NifX family protein
MKKTLFSTLVVLFLLPVMTYAAGKNAAKIAVASNSKDPKSSISSRAGHCPYYLIFDSTGELIEVAANPYKDAQRRAGQQTANFLADKGVTMVIAGNFGEKMIGVMRSNGTSYFKHRGAILDAVKKVLGPGNQILIKLDRNLGPVSCESYRKLINIEPDGRKREYVLFTVKKGRDKVAALFLSPAREKGRSTLRLVDNMWLYLPNTGKPVRIKKLQPMAGGVFNNSDILRLDYAAEYFVENMEELNDKYILNLKAKKKTAAYDKLKMWVDKDKILPIKVQCLTEASKLIKTIYFKQPKDFGDKILRPSVIEADSPLYKGHKSVMRLANIKRRTFKDEVFTPTFMPNLESLRQ